MYFRKFCALIGPFMGRQSLFCMYPIIGPVPHLQPSAGNRSTELSPSGLVARNTPNGTEAQLPPWYSTPLKCHFDGIVTEKAFMPFSDGSVMYCVCVPPVEAVLAPPPSPALATDVSSGPLQPKSVSAIRTAANLPLAI